MVFGTRVLKYWVLGPSGIHYGAGRRCLPLMHSFCRDDDMKASRNIQKEELEGTPRAEFWDSPVAPGQMPARKNMRTQLTTLRLFVYAIHTCWTPEVCRIMACWALRVSLGPVLGVYLASVPHWSLRATPT